MINEVKWESIWVTVLGLYPHKILVKWELEPTKLDLSQYSFAIYRSNNQETEFKNINTFIPSTANGEYLDYEPLLHNEYREYFYKMIATNTVTGNIIESDVITWEFQPDYKMLEMIRLLDDHLEWRIGSPCVLYYERTVSDSGHCPHCWDIVTNRQKTSSCSFCSGTGILGGYDGPQPVWIEFIAPNTKDVAHAAWGESQPGQSDILLSNYPVIKPRDVLIEIDTGSLWRITRVSTIAPQRTIIQQMARIDRMNKSDIENKMLTVPTDIKDVMVAQMEKRIEWREF